MSIVSHLVMGPVQVQSSNTLFVHKPRFLAFYSAMCNFSGLPVRVCVAFVAETILYWVGVSVDSDLCCYYIHASCYK